MTTRQNLVLGRIADIGLILIIVAMLTFPFIFKN